MEVWEAIILGLLQGLTEFLPVSSSGHLELANYIFGISEPNNLQFTMAVHCATVLSTIVVFWGEIVKLIKGLFKWEMNPQTLFIINIMVSLIPVAFVGLFFKDTIELLFTSNLMLVGSMLLVTATLLTFSHYAKPKMRPITPKRAFLIGAAQAVAVLPGLSRSGSTISTGLLLGVNRDDVAKFSFLMVLIPILGMSFLEIIGFDGSGGDTVNGVNILAGFITAFIAGVLACKIMIRMVSKGKLIWFAVYCAIVGVGSIITYLLN